MYQFLISPPPQKKRSFLSKSTSIFHMVYFGFHTFGLHRIYYNIQMNNK